MRVKPASRAAAYIAAFLAAERRRTTLYFRYR